MSLHFDDAFALSMTRGGGCKGDGKSQTLSDFKGRHFTPEDNLLSMISHSAVLCIIQGEEAQRQFTRAAGLRPALCADRPHTLVCLEFHSSARSCHQHCLQSALHL